MADDGDKARSTLTRKQSVLTVKSQGKQDGFTLSSRRGSLGTASGELSPRSKDREGDGGGALIEEDAGGEWTGVKYMQPLEFTGTAAHVFEQADSHAADLMKAALNGDMKV